MRTVFIYAMECFLLITLLIGSLEARLEEADFRIPGKTANGFGN